MRASVAAGRLKGSDKIGLRAGRVVNKYKVAKHFELTIEDRRFEFKALEEQIAAEAALDGIYVIRTAVPKKRMSAADAVRNYKALATSSARSAH
ncbi:transposase, IS4 family protein [mine drainage metagenome]|uniref:Transposase, IS4 family protein n=1 Tax=mine drainage metagenome TaxID=410659 RepID=T1A664_9ZZZZ